MRKSAMQHQHPSHPLSTLSQLTTNTSLDPSRPTALHLPPQAILGRLASLYHSLRRHHAFHRLVFHPDLSAHVLLAPMPPGALIDDSVRSIVGNLASLDPYYPPHKPPVVPEGVPSPLVLLRYAPASLPPREVEELIVAFEGVKDTKYSGAAGLPAGSSLPQSISSPNAGSESPSPVQQQSQGGDIPKNGQSNSAQGPWGQSQPGAGQGQNQNPWGQTPSGANQAQGAWSHGPPGMAWGQPQPSPPPGHGASPWSHPSPAPAPGASPPTSAPPAWPVPSPTSHTPPIPSPPPPGPGAPSTPPPTSTEPPPTAHCLIHFDSLHRARAFLSEISRTTSWSASYVSPTGPLPLSTPAMTHHVAPVGPAVMGVSPNSLHTSTSSSQTPGHQQPPTQGQHFPYLLVLVTHPATLSPASVSSWLRSSSPGVDSCMATETQPGPLSSDGLRTTEVRVVFRSQEALRSFCMTPPGSSLPPVSVRLKGDPPQQQGGQGGAFPPSRAPGMGGGGPQVQQQGYPYYTPPTGPGSGSTPTGAAPPWGPPPPPSAPPGPSHLALHPPLGLDPADLRRVMRLLPGFRRLHIVSEGGFVAGFDDDGAARRAGDVVAGLGHGVVSAALGGPAAAGMWGGVDAWRGGWWGVGGTPPPPPPAPPTAPPTTTIVASVPAPPAGARSDYFSRLASDHDGVISVHALGDASRPSGYAMRFRDVAAAARAGRDLVEGTSVAVRYANEGEDLESLLVPMGGGSGQTEGGEDDVSVWEDEKERERSGSRGSRRSSASGGVSDGEGEGGASAGQGGAGGPKGHLVGIKQRGRSHSQSSAHSATSASSAGGGTRVPRATVHITNLSAPGNGLDKADVKHLLSGYPGFRRVAFYRDWIFAVFESTASAANAVGRINTDTKMRASFARDEYAPNYVVPEAGVPCSVLYVCNLPWDATNLELTKLFKAYPGYREVYFFREACKVYFEDIESAEACMLDVNATTNLIATYFKGETAPGQLEDAAREEGDAVSVRSGRSAAEGQDMSAGQGNGPAESRPGPKCTLHVSNLTRDRADLKVHFQSYPGFLRIAYYPNWIFLVFSDASGAAQAINKIHATTRMQASFAQVEYTPGFVRPDPGPPGQVVRVGNFPSGAGEGEFVKLFRSYEGCTDVRFGREDCLVWFSSREAATRCLDDVNRTTNLCAVYYNPAAVQPAQPPLPQQPRMPAPGPAAGGYPPAFPGQPPAPPPGFAQFNQRQQIPPQQTEFWEDDEPSASISHSIPSSPGASSGDPGGRSSASSPFPSSERSYGADSLASSHGAVVGPGAGQMGVPGLAQAYGGGAGFPPGHPPKTTLKIGNINLDRSDLRKVLSSLRGFTKVAFYRDYVYACFADVESARAAMDLLHTSSRMRCVYPKYDYTTHNDRLDVGQPCPILHVSNMPFNSNSSEFVKMFGAYEGYRETQFFRESCLVFFATERDAAAALQDLNKTTNLVVVYSKKGLSALQALQQQGMIPYGNGPNPLQGYPGGDYQHSLPTDPALMEQFLRSVSASMSDQFEADGRRPSGSSNLTGGTDFGRDRRTSESDARLWQNGGGSGFGRSPSMPLSNFEGEDEGEYKRYARTPDSVYQDNPSGSMGYSKPNDIPDYLRQYIEKMQLQAAEMDQRFHVMQRQLAEKTMSEQRLKEEVIQLRAALSRFTGGRGHEIRRTEQQVAGRGGYGRFTPDLNGGPPGPGFGSALGLTRSTSGPPQRNVGFAQYAEEQYYAPSPTATVFPPQAQQFRGGPNDGSYPNQYAPYAPQPQQGQGPPSFELSTHDSIISMLESDSDRQEARRQQQQQQQQQADYDARDAWNSVTFGPQAGQGGDAGAGMMGGMGRGFGSRFGNGSIW
ncbi:hypothetical protein M427DRAFT_155877 [Gonapodya prolifera JEL478]|uniref:RRM domain-containing protein n=1 Tax=Gonapodya prolifera (strain JEL478) TaxID=1344416 RepID=A0A139AD18_GONPJ|nr:hypothetical protein M427DRAFT_155877 [Gonapodya prolifera JEL478]|eukprot:KXS14559.1 hypothetical protein M427DRAFT_155877 [Gonapodya prolifera JEL478]